MKKHNNQNWLLWIPRSCIVLVIFFFLPFIAFFWLVEYFFWFYFVNAAILFFIVWLTFHQSLLSGILVILFSLYGSLGWIQISLFKYCLLGLLFIAGLMLLVFSLGKQDPQPKKIPEKISKGETTIQFTGKALFWIFSPVILVMLFVSYFLLYFSAFKIGIVSGPSMLPTIHDGALLYISSVSFLPKRGDIIEFNAEPIRHKDAVFRNDNIVKRVIGLPFETVEWKDYQIYINGKVLKEPYQFDSFTRTFKLTNQFDTVVLGDGEYFVMGDNRTHSFDSRFFGVVKKEFITGLVFYIHNHP